MLHDLSSFSTASRKKMCADKALATYPYIRWPSAAVACVLVPMVSLKLVKGQQDLKSVSRCAELHSLDGVQQNIFVAAEYIIQVRIPENQSSTIHKPRHHRNKFTCDLAFEAKIACYVKSGELKTRLCGPCHTYSNDLYAVLQHAVSISAFARSLQSEELSLA